MRFLHTADLHLGKSLEGRSRAAEQAAFLEEIASLAERHEVDLVLLAGDIYDSFNPSAEAERLFYTFLRRVTADGARAVVLIAGNHDQPQRLSAAAPLAQAHGVYIVATPGQLPPPEPQAQSGRVQLVRAAHHVLHLRLPRLAEEVAVLALPYCSEARLQELYTRDLADEAGARADYQERLAALLAEAEPELATAGLKLGLAHLFLSGGAESGSERPVSGQAPSVGGSYGVRAGIFPAALQYVALGHLHRPQELNGRTPCVYAGSPLAYSFAEAGQAKSVVLGELAADRPLHWQRLSLTSGLPLSVWRARDYAEALAWCADASKRQTWVNLEIELQTPLTADETAALREAHPYLLNIKPLLPELALAEQSTADLGIEERFRQFVARQTGAEADEALVGLFMTLLAAGGCADAAEQDDLEEVAGA